VFLPDFLSQCCIWMIQINSNMNGMIPGFILKYIYLLAKAILGGSCCLENFLFISLLTLNRHLINVILILLNDYVEISWKFMSFASCVVFFPIEFTDLVILKFRVSCFYFVVSYITDKSWIIGMAWSGGKLGKLLPRSGSYTTTISKWIVHGKSFLSPWLKHSIAGLVGWLKW
jgi:hypothetical protein